MLYLSKAGLKIPKKETVFIKYQNENYKGATDV